MLLKRIKSKGLAHNSYFLSDGKEALVVDPRRDCAIYDTIAYRECTKIRYILETHRNEDYVIGSLELQRLTDAEIAHSRELPFKYGEYSLSDGESVNIGSLKIKALHTPGHTNESMCYVVYDSMSSDCPLIVFTGDTLFAGEVGRTDLYGLHSLREQSEKLYGSLHEKILPLGDHVIVYPAHGAGSVCGFAISDRDFTTIGYERKTNPVLQMDKESFLDHIAEQKMMTPPYFSKMEQHNLEGPPLLCKAPVPKPLVVEEFEEETSQPDAVIVDTREPGAFASSHIPDSLNIWLDGLSFFPGWVLEYSQKILLVMEREEDFKAARAYLWRLGFDNIMGYLCSGTKEWRNSGKPVECLGVLSPTTLRKMLDHDEIILVDVREESEWEDGHIEGSKNIYVGYLKEKANQLPGDKPIATTCEWGGRGGLAASILKKMGFHNVYNILGGMRAWRELEYSVKSE